MFTRHLSFTDAAALLTAGEQQQPVHVVESGGGGGGGGGGELDGAGSSGSGGGGGGGGAIGDARRVRTRMSLEPHAPVMPSEGGVLIFKGAPPPDLPSASSAAALDGSTRNFVFAGEVVQLLLFLRPTDSSLRQFNASLPPSSASAADSRIRSEAAADSTADVTADVTPGHDANGTERGRVADSQDERVGERGSERGSKRGGLGQAGGEEASGGGPQTLKASAMVARRAAEERLLAQQQWSADVMRSLQNSLFEARIAGASGSGGGGGGRGSLGGLVVGSFQDRGGMKVPGQLPPQPSPSLSPYRNQQSHSADNLLASAATAATAAANSNSSHGSNASGGATPLPSMSANSVAKPLPPLPHKPSPLSLNLPPQTSNLRVKVGRGAGAEPSSSSLRFHDEAAAKQDVQLMTQAGLEDEKPSSASDASTGPLGDESELFCPLEAAGMARRVLSIRQFENGDVGVLLEVAISANAPISHSLLEVFQFERFPLPPPSSRPPHHPSPHTPLFDTPHQSPASHLLTASVETPPLSPLGASLALKASSLTSLSSPTPPHIPSDDLLFWLFPLERLQPPPPSTPSHSRTQSAVPPSPLPSPSPSAWASSTSFNFGTATPFTIPLPRGPSPSTASSPRSQSPPHSPRRRLSFLRDEGSVEAGGGGRGGGGTEGSASGLGLAWGGKENGPLQVGWEGLMSFRGIPLEPQRFASKCSVSGAFIPGRKWSAMLPVLNPLRIESYSTDCTVDDVICLVLENTVPQQPGFEDVVLFIDRMTLECQQQPSTSSTSSTLLPLRISCVEAGLAPHSLPGLPLRPGEQHSFIVRPELPSAAPCPPPSSSALPAAASLKSTTGLGGGGGGESISRSASGKRGGEREEGTEEEDRRVDLDALLEEVDATPQYSIIISCRCSHTSVSLRFRHLLSWHPRPSRDLLLSLSLNSPSTSPPTMPPPSLPLDPSASSSPPPPLHAHSSLKPQTVLVKATNLSSRDVSLTLLAPTSLAATPLSRISFPSSPLRRGRPLNHSLSRSSVEEEGMGGDERGSGVEMGNDGEVEEEDEEEEEISFGGEEGMVKGLGKKAALAAAWKESSDSLRMVSIAPHMRHSLCAPPPSASDHLSAVELVAGHVPSRTHLWLQSMVPIGKVPAKGTAEVQCQVLPLVDGILTLDSLHVSTRRRDMLYIPEHPLNMFCMYGQNGGDSSHIQSLDTSSRAS